MWGCGFIFNDGGDIFDMQSHIVDEMVFGDVLYALEMTIECDENMKQ